MEDEEVVLGLIPAPDWVENRPLEEGGDIELAVAKKLQHCKEAEKSMEIKPKKENDDDIEEITLDSEEEEGEEVKIKQEEALNIEANPPFRGDEKADTTFQEGNEDEKIETNEEKPHFEMPIVFSTEEEGEMLKMKQEVELHIESPPEFPEAEENKEANMDEGEEPHIEAVTVFSDSDEGGEIKVKQEEELQIDSSTEYPGTEENEEVNMYEDDEPHIEAVTVFSDSEESEEDTKVDQKTKRYNIQGIGNDLLTFSIPPLQGTIIETPVQDVFGCNSCPMSFSNTSELSKHVRCHPPRKKPFCCRVCLKTDTLAANLKRHMRTHSGEKPYSCVLCSKMFTSAYSLKIHMRIHSGYKPYVCDKCPRAFYQKTDLNKHAIIHFRSEEILQGSEDLPEYRDSNSLNQNGNVRRTSTVKVYSRDAKSRVSRVTSSASHYVLSPPSNENPQKVNSQNRSPSNTLHDSPAPFAPVITEVVGSFHEEDSEMEPSPLPTNNRDPQKEKASHPISLASNQIRMEKAVYTQPVSSSPNPRVTNNTNSSNSGVKQFAVTQCVYKQQETCSVSSQNKGNSGTTLISPVQLSNSVGQNKSKLPVTPPKTTFVNNIIPKPSVGETFCIPLILNGQMCYAIPAPTTSQFSVVSNPTSVQTSVQPVNSHTGQETFLLPVFVPPIPNGVQNPNLSQPAAAPAVSPQTMVLGSAGPSQPQHQIRFQTAPVSTVTCIRTEHSSGSQVTPVNTVARVQVANSTGSQVTTVNSVPRVPVENSTGSQVKTVNSVPSVRPENASRSQMSPVNVVQHVRPENSTGSQMPTMNIFQRVRPEITSRSQMSTVKVVPHVRSENSTRSQMITVKSVPCAQPENTSGHQMSAVKTGLHVRPQNSSNLQRTYVKPLPLLPKNKRLIIPSPPVSNEYLQTLNHYENHHNHNLTLTTKGSNGFVQQERVYCNTCKACVSVYTKRIKHDNVS